MRTGICEYTEKGNSNNGNYPLPCSAIHQQRVLNFKANIAIFLQGANWPTLLFQSGNLFLRFSVWQTLNTAICLYGYTAIRKKIKEEKNKRINNEIRQCGNELIWKSVNTAIYKNINTAIQKYINTAMRQYRNTEMRQYRNETKWKYINT